MQKEDNKFGTTESVCGGDEEFIGTSNTRKAVVESLNVVIDRVLYKLKLMREKARADK